MEIVRECANLAAAAVLSFSPSNEQSARLNIGTTMLDTPKIWLLDNGPYDPEDNKRRQSPRSELHPYVRSSEEMIMDDLYGLAALGTVGTVVLVIWGLHKFKDRYY